MEEEAKRPVQSVIARLMGLDELQPQQPVLKRPRVLSEDYLRRVASIGSREKCVDRCPFWLDIEEKNRYRSLFQVSETLKRGRHLDMSIEKRELYTTNSSELKVTLKRGDVKQVPVNKKLRSSEEKLPRYPRCTDLLATQKSQALSGRVEISKSLHGSGYGEIGGCRKSWTGMIEQGKLESGVEMFSCAQNGQDNRHWLLEPQHLQSSNRSCLLTTGIAVLKRKLGKSESAGRCFSSSIGSHVCSCPGVREHNGILAVPDKHFVEMKGRRKLGNGMESGRQRSRISKEVVRKTGHGINKMSAETPRSENGSQDTIAKESNLMIRYEPSRSERKKNSYYVLNEFTNNIRSGELADRNKNAADGCDKNETVNFHTPASEDWIDSKIRHGRSRMKPRSLLAELNASRSPSSKPTGHPLQNGKLSSDKKDGSESSNAVSLYNLPSSNSCSQSQKSHSEEDMHIIQNDPTGKVDDPREEKIGASMPWGQRDPNLQNSWVIPEARKEQGIDRNLHSVLDPSFQQDISNGISEADTSYFSGEDQDSESTLSLEEAYSSPDSVLEPPDGKELLSSTDYSGNVTFHGLHMHLELLKSGTDSDDGNGKGSGVGSEESENHKRLFGIEDSREFLYLVDVLIEAGFDARYLHVSSDVRPSQQYSLTQQIPLSCYTFEKLEKKYGDDISWESSERKLLFDRIHSGMMKISQPLIGIPIWRKSVAQRLLFRLNQDLFAEELWKLLVTQEKEASTGSTKSPGQDEDWLEMRDDIQIIGREIEDSLLDELVEEVVMDDFLQLF